jgi:maltooligosyltrehalose trehalohydrolase
MKTLRVWAPRARSLAVQIGSRRLTLEGENPGSGWWRLENAELSETEEYGFILDGEEKPLPDPRSLCQPYGVHGLSRVVNHNAFTWSDSDFVAPKLDKAIIYELHIGTFTPDGTFDSVIPYLNHLVSLGVTHIELMPIAEFPGSCGWGYDGVDLFAAHHAYGGPIGLKRLVDACHGKGLAVLLDVVYNHFGPSGNYLQRFGPYLTDRYATLWGAAVNFDGRRSDEVRRFVCDNAMSWMRDYHIDGLRLDAIHAIMDLSPTHLLEKLAIETAELSRETGRNLVLIAEDDRNDPRPTTNLRFGGYGLDAQWNDDFHHALHAVLAGERSGYYADFGSLAQLAKSLRHAFVYDGQFSPYRGRTQGRSAAGKSGLDFVGFLQNHDQVGNRAIGERSSQLLTTSQLLIGAAIVLTAPFIPMLFQGEEWGASTPFLYFTDHTEPALARAVSEGRQNEFAAFGWDPASVPDPQDSSTFLRSKLDWSELTREPHKSIFEWHRRLIRLRRLIPELRDGRLDLVKVSYSELQRWLVMTRAPITAAFNLSRDPQQAPLEMISNRQILLNSTEETVYASDTIQMPPESVVIIGPAELAGL